MFRHRRVRILTVLLSGWVVLTAVERVAEEAPWARAVLGGLMWAALVAGVWWFAEWTQSPLRTARESAAARRRAENTPHDEPAGTDTELVAHQGEPSAPSHS
ncbi:hypothetical protein [Streptomyces sp. NPDC006289]|uniref:hypothetical protein n=1 Tax=Streptomyces sp. NPDC006289 TaxID=3156744 RepID=UPI0033ACBE1F